MGKQVCLALLVNSDLKTTNEEPQPFPDGEICNFSSISRKNILEELKANKELLKDNEDDSSSGSDSDPSEDNLDMEETALVYPSSVPPKPKVEERKTPSAKKRVESKRSLTSQKDRNRTVQKCKLCGEQELPGHVCSKPKPKLRPIVKTQPIYAQPSQPYYNAQGKKVRDQATQTTQIPQTGPLKVTEEAKIPVADTRNNSSSPLKKDSRGSIRANSSDESPIIAKFWKNEKAFPNLTRNSRKSPSCRTGEILKK